MNEYNKAIERLKQWGREHENAGYIISDRDKFIFPELAESEDERIRKEIRDYFAVMIPGACQSLSDKYSRWIAYLEKQKDIITDYEDRLDRCACDNFNKGFKAGVEKQKERKIAEWSEEEKDMLNRINSCIRWAMNDRAFGSCKRLIGDKEGVKLQDFLRSIAKPCVPQTEGIPSLPPKPQTKNRCLFGGLCTNPLRICAGCPYNTYTTSITIDNTNTK